MTDGVKSRGGKRLGRILRLGFVATLAVVAAVAAGLTVEYVVGVRRPDPVLPIGMPSAPLDPATVPRFAGDGYSAGYAQGLLFGEEIRRLKTSWLDGLYGGGWLRRLALRRARDMEAFIPPALRAEMQGLADGAGATYDDILLANATPDLMQLAFTPFGCSSFVVTPGRSRSGAMLVGRNLDYPFSDALRASWRPVVFARTEGHAVLAVSVPGLVGVVTGVNDAGLYLAMHTVLQLQQTSHALPTILGHRLALEASSTLNELRTRLVAAPRPTGSNLMLADAATALVLERRSRDHAERVVGATGIHYAANHYASGLRGMADLPSDWRWPRLERRAASATPLSMDDVRATIAGTGQDPINVLAVFLDYGSGQLYFGTEAPLAAAGALRSIDVRAVLTPTSGAITDAAALQAGQDRLPTPAQGG